MTSEGEGPSADPYGMRLATAQLVLARRWDVTTRTASATIASWARTLEVQIGVIVDLVLEEIHGRHGPADHGVDPSG